MPIPVNQIGPFQFVTLDGVPVLPYLHAELIQRPGVDGSAFLQTGRRGEEFELQSGADVPDWATALRVEDEYRLITNNGTYDLIRGGISYSSLGVAFVVRGVIVTDKRRLSASAGGLVGGLAYVRARWRLITV